MRRNRLLIVVCAVIGLSAAGCTKSPQNGDPPGNNNPQVSIPTVTTADITDISSTTAKGGGNVTADGGGAVTARGLCWNSSPNPTTANSKTTDGSGTGSFSSTITALTEGTMYYVRAYATNSAGTAYGQSVSFTAGAVPTVTTANVTSITGTTAVSGGNVTNDGGSTVMSRGVCWSTNPTPTIADSKSNDGTGTGSFTSNVTGLSNVTTYYLRAYATNSFGTGYGSVIQFTTTTQLPSVTTTAVGSVTDVSAISGGNISTDGGTPITARGVCWNTSPQPTIANFKTEDGTGTGGFTSQITGLTQTTTYYLRAYATNSTGTAYGEEFSFTTAQTINYGSVSDIEGNQYRTYQIGALTWMVDNLRTTKYNDNTAIPNITIVADWFTATTGAYVWYNNETGGDKEPFGALYNWRAVNTGKLCPQGWRVPSNAEWTAMINSLGNGDLVGKMKDSNWWTAGQEGNNSSRFSARPGGLREMNGTFRDFRTAGYWWSSTENDAGTAHGRSVSVTAVQNVTKEKNAGYSVRCVTN